MRGAVGLPQGEDENEWLAVNVVDFFNEVSLLYGIVAEEPMDESVPNGGFPEGFTYMWGEGLRAPIECTADEYVNHVMTWVEEQINDESVFPSDADAAFPRSFKETVKTVFKRLFRAFAIIYASRFQQMEALGAVAHLNTSFKHFIFFCLEFDLVGQRELQALSPIVQPLVKQFQDLA
mmetsp:Transcript_22018/g.67589  ORF Transcript_22018/g.67589 Transcript_22018/m.67589 type:complete len:178 (+) Transcript_22018:265-798(+)